MYLGYNGTEIKEENKRKTNVLSSNFISIPNIPKRILSLEYWGYKITYLF
jgi:hypothetical protein